MSECISSYPNEENQRIAAAERIGQQARGEIDRLYGGGYPAWQRGHHDLPYHNGHHSRAVGEGATKLAVALGLSGTEVALARAAGFAHDIVQLKGRGYDEAESAQWLDAQLEHAGIFPPHLRHMGTLAILGTEPLFADGQLVGQKASELEYPSKAAELIAKSAASGDLAHLFAPEGPYLSHMLFREINKTPHQQLYLPENLVAFQHNQIALLERYHYPLKEANTVFGSQREPIIDYHSEILDAMAGGTVETWDELLRRDLAFIAHTS